LFLTHRLSSSTNAALKGIIILKGRDQGVEVGLGIDQVLTFGLIMSFVGGGGMSMLVVFSCDDSVFDVVSFN
jgi:hypothetical protein